MRFLFIICSLSLFFCSAQAQNDSTISKNNFVTVKQAPGIEKIVKTYTDSYTLLGYRIQIGSETKIQEAKKIRVSFVSQFKDMVAYELYQSPYYKIRIGDFKTKLEAIKFQQQIINQYPNCFIVKDEINFIYEN